MSVVESDIEVVDLEAQPTNDVVCIKNQQNAINAPIPTEAYKMFRICMKYLGKVGRILGVELSSDWKPNLRYNFMRALLSWFWSQVFYTQIMYIYKHDSMKVLEVFPLYGIGASNVFNLICYAKYFSNITALMNTTSKICQRNTGIRAQKIKERVQDNLIFYKWLMVLILIVTFIYMYYPLYSYVFNGILVPFIPVEFMFVDNSTNLGFLISSILQALLGVYAISGDVYMGYVLMYVIFNYRIYVDIIEIDFKEFDKFWDDTSTSTLLYRHMYLKNICRKYIDMKRYVGEVKKIFDEKIFRFFFVAYWSQIICLYEIRVNDWITGYALAIGLIMQMICMCCLGSLLTLDNDRLCYYITQSEWYKYDAYSRKIILSLLNMAMNYDELSIGPTKELNVCTAVEIVKSIYSYYTIMMELL